MVKTMYRAALPNVALGKKPLSPLGLDMLVTQLWG